MSGPADSIPVHVLTGFLGSGKTTLLARLVRAPAFARTAVIINEFGAVGIDHDLIEAGEESFVTLESGCLCCTVRGDLEATLADLVARRASAEVPAFERVVIETSGLADPAPVLNAILVEASRGAGISLGSIITTVAGVGGSATLEAHPQSRRQVAAADRILVTKTDLEPLGEALVAQLSALNPRAPILTAVDGVIAPDRLFPSEQASDEDAMALDDWLGRARDLGAAPAHDPDIRFLAIRRERPLPALAVTLLLEALADHCGTDLLRLKGLIAIAEMPDRPAVVHGVQHIFHEPRWLSRWPSSDHATRLVLIGRGLTAVWIERLLDAIEAELAEVTSARQPR